MSSPIKSLFSAAAEASRIASKYCHCEPTSLTLASIAIAGAGAGASIAGQSAQNSAAKQVEQQKANAVDRQIEENRRRATDDYVASVRDEQLLEAQEHEALAEKTVDLSRTERDASSQANVAAAESGVVGQSLAAIHNDYRMQMDQAASRLGINQKMADYTHSRRIEGYQREFTNRVSSVQPYQQAPVKPVDWYGPLFSIPNAGLQTAIQTDAFHLKNPLAS